MTLSIAVVYGSVRPDRLGIRAARWLVSTIEARGHAATLVDPIEHPFPLLEKRFAYYAEGEAPGGMAEVAETFRKADAILIVSGEYNHGIPPALKNLMDHFLEEFFWRPAGIACYSAGRYGGVRAAMQLRMTLPEQGMVSIPSLLPIPEIGKLFDEAGVLKDGEWLVRAAGKFLDELEWYARAMKAGREGGTPY
ncbi:MAG: NAD(P)H-dependent oxidoreductase [Rhizobiaceae bacterium]|nr:NAD(P)H-dependent oxidoreductase [Rhizobiaceae bacterium]